MKYIRYTLKNDTPVMPTFCVFPAFDAEPIFFSVQNDIETISWITDTKTRVLCPPSSFQDFSRPIRERIQNPIAFCVGMLLIGYDDEQEFDNAWSHYFVLASQWIQINYIEKQTEPPTDEDLFVIYVPPF